MPLQVLIITSVWPEPDASAAGVRDRQLIDLFREAGWQVTVTSPARSNFAKSALERLQITTFTTPPNDSGFDDFVRNLQPDMVIFDRFVIEEQFGWRVRLHAPKALRVLDTQDLHHLRHAREMAIENGASVDAAFAVTPTTESTEWLREMASIHRSDAVLAVSLADKRRLEAQGVAAGKIHVASFFMLQVPASTSFEERAHFVSIGNFRHTPNEDALRWCAREVWPRIRAELPRAELHAYGAYPPREAMAMSQPETGFHVRGPAKHVTPTLQRYRILLAPLRFGAGIKGKIAEAWLAGTPVVTTPIGREGMEDGGPWGGWVASTADDLAHAAVHLYEDVSAWEEAQRQGQRLIRTLFDRERQGADLLEFLRQRLAERDFHRSQDLISGILWLQNHRSTEYLSRWIELKNRLQRGTKGPESEPPRVH